MPVALYIDDVEVPRDDRKGLSWSSVVPGGDDRLSVDVTCRSEFFDSGVPLQRSHVKLLSAEGDELWVGWLRKPVIQIEEGGFVGVRLEAEGYQYSGLVEPFEEHQVYGPASVGSSSLDKLVTASVIDAIDHARTQKTPLITATRYMTTGFNFDEDTESFFQKTAVDVWNTANALMGYIANPLYWQVYSIDNQVTLEFFPHGGTADYFERGRAKRMDLEFDANDVVWRCAVAFGGEQVYIAPASPVTPAIATPYTQGKVLNLEAEVKSLNQVTLVGEQVVSQMNQVRITGGTVVLDAPLDAVACSDLSPEYMRAGRMIELTIPLAASPYNTNDTDPPGTISGLMYIRRFDFSEDSCEARLSASPWTDDAKAARMLPFQSTPGLTWGIAFGTFNPPPKVDKLWFVGSTPDPSRTPALTPIVGSVIPTGYKTDTQHDYGPAGAVFDPQQIPKEVVVANFSIEGMRDGSGVLQVITAETNVLREAIPEMVVERIELLADVSGSITVAFHKFIRASETTTSNYLSAASLSSEQFSETVIASADPDPGDPDTRKTFRTGDWLIIDVTGVPVNVKKLGIAVIGRKIWESHMPRTQGPGWVNRPASPSWPHNAGW